MRRGSLIRIAMLAGLWLTLGSSVAIADEMRTVTFGSITYSSLTRTFLFGGDDFSVEGVVRTSGVTPAFTHFDREPGEVFTANNRWVGTDLSGIGSAEVGGVNVNAPFLSGDLQLTTGPIVVPNTGVEMFTITAPFRFGPEAFLAGYSESPQTTHLPPLFRFGLLGGGVATSVLELIPGASNYQHVRTVWTFQVQQPAPVPEPTSMLLLGTAVCGLVAARRRKLAAGSARKPPSRQRSHG